MRSAPTDAEHRLWQIVRAHRFAGHKFRRQVPIDSFIVDFLCPSARLIVELDGGQHGGPNDERRDAHLRRQGFRIMRVWNDELFTNEEGVAEAIMIALRSPLPNPSPAGRRGASGAKNG